MGSNIKAYLNNIMRMVETIRDVTPDTERGEEIVNLCNDIMEEIDLIEVYLDKITELDDKMTNTKEELGKLEKRVGEIEKEIVKIEKYLDWITGKLSEIPEKCFSKMNW